jgi:hypothetical protein
MKGALMERPFHLNHLGAFTSYIAPSETDMDLLSLTDLLTSKLQQNCYGILTDVYWCV